jgi:hypothetical protein
MKFKQMNINDPLPPPPFCHFLRPISQICKVTDPSKEFLSWVCRLGSWFETTSNKPFIGIVRQKEEYLDPGQIIYGFAQLGALREVQSRKRWQLPQGKICSRPQIRYISPSSELRGLSGLSMFPSLQNSIDSL